MRRVTLAAGLLVGLATAGVVALAVSGRTSTSVAGAEAAGTDVATLTGKDAAPFAAYLKQHGQPPTDYVVSAFREHDIVILGEMHEVPENLAFIADLIEPLYRRAKVGCLATEFLRSRNTARANQILSAPEYEEAAVVDLYRDFPWVWGFREYMDIFHAIWTVNHSLPPGAPRFRVIGLEGEVEEYDVQQAPEARRAALREKLMARDAYMAEVFAKEATAGTGKVLLHTGYMHSFTHYRSPVVEAGKLVRELEPRLGGLLARRYGTRVFQICLHQWQFGPELFTGGQPSGREPLGGLLERALAATGKSAVGFDVEGSPFAPLRDRQSCYFAYQERVVFSDIAQGYIILKPLKDLGRHCTWVQGFVAARNFAKARGIALQRGWIREGEGTTPADLDQRLKQLMESN